MAEPILSLRAVDSDGLYYRIDGRLRFRGEEATWTQEVGALSASETVDVDLDAGALLSSSDDQEQWASDLRVVVVAQDASGQDVARTRALPLRLVFLDGAPLLLTESAAAELAPSGAFGDNALASLPGYAHDGVRVEHAGESGVESDAPLGEEE